MRNVLVVAFHFPPMGGSSGLLRSLKFARYLPEHGWQPTILTAHPRVYDRLDESGLAAVPEDVRVIRAFALDTKKHLAIRSRYPGLLAMPDRWVSWAAGAIPAGLAAIRRHEVDVVFSTYPIATAVLVGLALKRLSGRPWVADFRDPMTEEDFPPDPRTRRAHAWIEARAVRHAARLVYTTDSTRLDQLRLHPGIGDGRSLVISNGYDEDDFRDLDTRATRAPGAPLRLVHGGVIYPHDRDPRPLFRALRRMREQSLIDAGRVRIELRGSSLDASVQSLVTELGIDDIVHFLPPIPYRESLADAAAADGLIVMQGESCDRQIPAKVYEYLRLGKPIFALTTDAGETATLLRRTGGATVARLADEEDIAPKLADYLAGVDGGEHPRPAPERVAEYARSHQAALLAQCLDGVVAGR